MVEKTKSDASNPADLYENRHDQQQQDILDMRNLAEDARKKIEAERASKKGKKLPAKPGESDKERREEKDRKDSEEKEKKKLDKLLADSYTEDKDNLVKNEAEKLAKEAEGKNLEDMLLKAKEVQKRIEDGVKKFEELEKDIQKLRVKADAEVDLIEKAQIESQIEEKNNQRKSVMDELIKLEEDLNQLNYYIKNKEVSGKIKTKAISGAKGAGKLVAGSSLFLLKEAFTTSWRVLKTIAGSVWDEVSKLTGAGGFWEDAKKIFKKVWGSKQEGK